MPAASRARMRDRGRRTEARRRRAASAHAPASRPALHATASPAAWHADVQRLGPAQLRDYVTGLGATAGTGAAAPPVQRPVQRFVGGVLETIRETFSVDIGASVGARGANRPSDVRRVQIRLVRLGFLAEQDAARERPAGTEPAPQEALSGTIAAITRYQTEAVGLRRGDGRVHSGGRTHEALAANRRAPSRHRRPTRRRAAVVGAALQRAREARSRPRVA